MWVYRARVLPALPIQGVVAIHRGFGSKLSNMVRSCNSVQEDADSGIWNLGADNKSCATDCALEGADYKATYGAATCGDSLKLEFVTKGTYATNIRTDCLYGNVNGWKESSNDQKAGVGGYGSCCAEMDIWEANAVSAALTPHSCQTVSQTMCSGCYGVKVVKNKGRRYEGSNCIVK